MTAMLRSMTGRVFLLLISGVLLTAMLTLGLVIMERQQLIGQFRGFHAVERVAQFILSVETVPPAQRVPFLNAAARSGLSAELAERRDQALPVRTELAERLQRRLDKPHRIESAAASPNDCAPPSQALTQPRPHRRPCEVLLVTLSDGSRLRVTVVAPRAPPMLAPQQDILAYGVLFLVGIAFFAWLVARMTMRPLKQLADAATALGNDVERPPLPERGATEIRQAAAAFNAMQERIRHQIQQRSQILAAVTHDLQTPLTRLRLRLEKVEDAELRDKLVKDLSAMQAMVKEGLDLARSVDSKEPLQRLDIDSLVESICADAADAGQSVFCQGRTGVSLLARPIALRRCLNNLIDNALKYGQAADVRLQKLDTGVLIRICDQGPGIPEPDLERVFEPFFRLEASRSRDTGGTGLGLTIARHIAEQHGGTLRLQNLKPQGLEVNLRFPCAR